MSRFSIRSRALAVGVVCAAGGVGAGAVATAGASTSSSHHKTHHAQKGKHSRGGGLRAVAGHSAQGSVVVHTKDGYKTITFERGTVQSVNGNQLTIAEGPAKDAYKTATITVPSNASVRDNGKKSSMSSVTTGQRVLIVQGPKRTIVRAHSPKAQAQS